MDIATVKPGQILSGGFTVTAVELRVFGTYPDGGMSSRQFTNTAIADNAEAVTAPISISGRIRAALTPRPRRSPDHGHASSASVTASAAMN
jgi:hypothetical protein